MVAVVAVVAVVTALGEGGGGSMPIVFVIYNGCFNINNITLKIKFAG
jgi:hypothetical protein